MDPLAHTLAGASLAETGLKRTTPLATATLLIAANLPDVDALASFAGSDASLHFRRGWTHGVLAMAVLPLVLTGLVLAWDRAVRRRRRPDAPPARPARVLALATLGVLSHPALDWLNTYGVRLLMPFDGRWFYGDVLFIVDPWFWLLVAAGAVLAHSASRRSAGLWGLLAALASALVTLAPMVPLAAKVAWWVGLAGLVALRVRRGAALALPASRTALTLLAAYIAAMAFGTSLAREQAAAALAAEGVAVRQVMAGPVPANPFVREVVVVTDGEYHLAEVRWLEEPPVRRVGAPVPMVAPPGALEIVRAATTAPGLRGTLGWLRFPAWEVRERPGGGWRVVVRDLRYARPGQDAGFGVATVEVDASLAARAVRVGR